MTTNETTIEYLKKLEMEQYYGDLLIKLEAGKVVHLAQSQALKPKDLVELLKIPVAFNGKT